MTIGDLRTRKPNYSHEQVRERLENCKQLKAKEMKHSKTKAETATQAAKNARPIKEEILTLAAARDIFYEKFRTNLRLLRAKTGLSAVDLSNSISMKSGRQIINLEYGRINPSVE